MLLAFVLLLMISACRNDLPVTVNEEPLPEFNPTPYQYNLPEYAPRPPRPPADNPTTVEGVSLGRMLFYDKKLSGDNTQSCASCHNQADAFTDSGRRFSVGILGIEGKRNSMPLFNLDFADRFFWDGRARSLEEQALMPIAGHSEMAEKLPELVEELKADKDYPAKFYAAFGTSEINEELIAKAIAQFLRSMVSFRSKYDSVRFLNKGFFSESEQRGYELFFSESGGDCFHCHSEGNLLFSTFTFENNGLTAAAQIEDFPDPGLGSVSGRAEDYGLFKVPSLRNVALTAPYMHDGRFATLKEVLDFYSDSLQYSLNINYSNLKRTHLELGGMKLSEEEKWDIIAFLHTLTDRSAIQDSSYSDPFK
jgi:cytochrome c peroxidase